MKIFLLLILCLFSSSIALGQGFTGPRQIVLPADDAAHVSSQVSDEWWYYNGHLRSISGHSYGFDLVFFQTIQSGQPVEAVQFAITDIDGKLFHQNTWLNPGTYPEVANAFELSVPGGPAVQGRNGLDHLSATLPDGSSLVLDLSSLKPAVDEMDDGYVPYVDPSSNALLGYDFYYSRTRMATAGSLTINGMTEAVAGMSWFDHEWGQLPALSWEWYSIQLNNGEELMAYNIREYQTPTVIEKGATFVGTLGETTAYRATDFQMASSGSWTSPHTGTVFPTLFSVSLPAKELNLTLSPVLEDQEVFGSLNYWEGAVNVAGIENGVDVQGLGYVELSGY